MTTTETERRYPIGRFVYSGDESAEARKSAIEAIAALPSQLRGAVAGLTDEQLDTPYRDGGWTLREVVHHVADSHMNAYVRWKLALTEHAPTIKPYDESNWAKLPDSRLPIDVSLNLIDSLHARFGTLMSSMSESDWDRTYFHPEHRRAVPLREVLELYAWHGKHHTAHITSSKERNGWS